MTKRLCMVLVTLGVLVGFGPRAGAQEGKTLKIGVVITQRLLASTEIGKGAAEKLRGKQEAAQQQLDRKSSEISDMKKDLEKRLMVLKPNEKDKAREEFERKSRDGIRLKEDLERELRKEESKVFGEVNEFLSKVVIEYGKDHGYDLILDATSAIYFSETPDITDDVIAAADKAYKK